MYCFKSYNNCNLIVMHKSVFLDNYISPYAKSNEISKPLGQSKYNLHLYELILWRMQQLTLKSKQRSTYTQFWTLKVLDSFSRRTRQI